MKLESTPNHTLLVIHDGHYPSLIHPLRRFEQFQTVDINEYHKNNKPLPRPQKFCLMTQNPNHTLQLTRLAAENNIPTEYWEIKEDSFSQFLLEGLLPPQPTNNNETLQSRFHRFIHKSSPVPQIILKTPHPSWLKDLFSNKSSPLITFMHHPESQKHTACKEAFLRHYIHRPYQEKPKPTGIGLNYAVELFQNNWFDLYHDEKDVSTSTLANTCLELIAIDETFNAQAPLHYNLKAYWSLYTNDHNIISSIHQEMKTTFGHSHSFPSHLAFVLWCMNHHEAAKSLINQEEHPELIKQPDLLHINAITHILLEQHSQAEKTLTLIKPEFLEDGTYPHKYFHHALAARKLGLCELENTLLKTAAKCDPQLPEKHFLLDHVVPTPNPPESLLTRLEPQTLQLS